MVVSMQVKEAGYLKNAVVNISNNNYEIDTENLENAYINSASETQVKFNQIDSGKTLTLELPIKMRTADAVSQNYLSQVSNVDLTATYVDKSGKENKVNKNIKNQVIWEGKAQAEVNGEITKYIPYNQGEEYGVLLQAKVQTNLKDNVFPINNTSVELEVPQIVGNSPEEVNVYATQTTSSNGDEKGTEFNQENYEYNKETGTVKITVNNKANTEGNIAWLQNGKDEYIINMIYTGKEVYDLAKENGVEGTIPVKAKISLSNESNTKIEKELNITFQEEKEKGLLTDLNLSLEGSISKGYIYANYAKGNKADLETPYKVNYNAQVNSAKLAKSIQFATGEEAYVNKENEEVEVGTGSYIKTLRINKKVFDKILGEEGNIEVSTVDGSKIATIQKDSVTSEKQNENNAQADKNLKLVDGNYELDLSERKLQEVSIKTSEIKAEGILEISLDKVLSTNQNYTLNEMKKFNSICINAQNEMNEKVQPLKGIISMQEVTSKAEITIAEESKNLSTAIVNENVEIRATLDISSMSHSLYKNPSLKIKLPKYISKVEIKDSNLLMGYGLKIKDIKQETKDGSKVIVAELTGTQTEYALNSEYKGTILIINANLTVDTLAPSGEADVEMTYTNEFEASSNKQGNAKASVNIVAPTGIIAANGIADYSKKANDIMTVSTEKTTEAKLQTYSEKQIATVSGKVVNNYNNNIQNVTILGRIPAKNSTQPETGEVLGSTFDSKLSTQIKVSGIDEKNYSVYYSNKPDATSDLNSQENAWSSTATNSSKSYLIKTNDNLPIKQGEQIDFEYKIEIPENLSYNNTGYEMYQVYYDNVSSVGTLPETKISPIVEASTGEGPNIKATITPTVDVVREGQIVKMKLTVTNSGSSNATNVIATVTAPEGAQLVNSSLYSVDSNTQNITIGTLKPNETKEAYYYVKIDDSNLVDEGTTSITHNIEISATELENPMPVSYAMNNIQKAKILVELSSFPRDNATLKLNEKITLYLRIKKVSENPLKNVKVSIKLPKNLKYISENDDLDGYEESTNTITGTITNMDQESYSDQITVQVVDSGDISLLATAIADEIDTHYSNMLNMDSQKPEIKLSNLTSTPKYVKEGEKITYKIDVSNNGTTYASNIPVEVNWPKELGSLTLTYVDSIQTHKNVINVASDSSVAKFNISRIDVGDVCHITFESTARILPDENSKEISSKITINGIESNTVKNTIEYNKQAREKSPLYDDPTVSEGSSTLAQLISGTAWLDENKNGAREETESLLENIQIVLLNSKTNQIAKDAINGQDMITTTNKEGKYTFNNVAEGEYLVVFVYNAANYSATTYQAKDVDASINSDAIEMNITLNGERKLVGISDVIKITTDNARDIDIGLYKVAKFDLSLQKYVSKITLTTPTIGTRVYSSQDTKLGKVEILGSNAGKASMIIEYKLVVKNEGAVAGYAKRLVDYIPEGVGFSTSSNKDWYLSENGNVYNTSLANVLIKPGETKEVTLVVTKKITSNDMGKLLNNNAEIDQSYNEEGLADIDSTVSNKSQEEDDMSGADIMISTVTGTIIKYVSLALAVIAIIVFGIYEIKKRVLINVERR